MKKMVLPGNLAIGGFVSALQIVLLSGLSPAENQAATFVCSGFNSHTSQYGAVGALACHAVEGYCPAGWAYTSVRPIEGSQITGEYVPVAGDCCRLPDGVLLDEHEYALEQCPEGTVATGARTEPSYSELPRPKYPDCYELWKKHKQYLRCTKIDQTRFRLGNPSSGLRVGWSNSVRSSFIERSTTRARIPVSLRYGVGRYARSAWSPVACVGYPWGSLLTGKSSKYCSGFSFRQVLHRGGPGMPETNTPVELFSKMPQVVRSARSRSCLRIVNDHSELTALLNCPARRN